ncbi:MAG: zf-HC2 domain-containing protein [Acidimicrobiales bacterium]|nr:zf-HC2 domain-containing protein [Acidimicrobiales bacterium]
MQCSEYRELISALLDGECDDFESALVQRHLEQCAPCRKFKDQAALLHRGFRLTPAPEMPDLATHFAQQRRRDQLRYWGGMSRVSAAHRGAVAQWLLDVSGSPHRLATALRAALASVGLIQFYLGFEQIAGDSGVHANHHLGAWDLAFAVGLLVVAVQPWRTRGFLPVAATVVVTMTLMAVKDVVDNRTSGMAETAHVLELAGLLLAWALAKTGVDNRPVNDASGRSDWRRRPRASDTLQGGFPPGDPYPASGPRIGAEDRTKPRIRTGSRTSYSQRSTGRNAA